MKVIVDGNDGTGKTTLVCALKKKGYHAYDRGIPTTLTMLDDIPFEIPTDEIYIILDVPVEVSQERLLRAGKSLNQPFHTIRDLTYYRRRFQEVAEQLPRCHIIDVSKDDARGVLRSVLCILEHYK
ncbi:MAG: hypothetical protein HZA36_03480 [Parcubacteria group bacterium]|nr:hypothetical protein [Parcubacteria group bacterium]